EQVSDRLWGNNWDILFFAGHSTSDNQSGRINTRANEYLTINKLKPGLKNAIEKGLQLAIFNSCDGLQLAYDLADLNIPQVIVMREPVPDVVAERFLRHFLTAFSRGESLYLAVREAKGRLYTEGLEDEFPGVTWLPIICQNPAEVSLVWSKQKIKEDQKLQKSQFTPSKKTWECVHTLSGHSEIVRSVAISPDGKILASASLDQTIKLWDILTGELLDTLTAHTGSVTCVTFSPDGQTLASSSSQPDGTIKLWDYQKRIVKSSLKGTDWVVLSVWAIAFNHDGTILASGHHADSTVKIWDLNTQQLKHTLRGHVWAVESVKFSPDGQILASGSLDSNIKIWNPRAGQEIRNLNRPSGLLNPVKSWFSDNSIYSVAFSPDGKTLASGGGKQPIKLWRVSNGELKTSLPGHTDDVYAVVFSPDGQTLASGSADYTIRIWDLFTGEPLHTLGHTDKVYCLAYTHNGETLISGSQDRTIKIWQKG
ncbi:MAG: CHAT domain-containing protein, partial [Crinalium sp.]